MIGYQFSVSSTQTVTGLAYLDAAGSGLVDSHQVGIFDLSGKLLVSATVPAGPSVKMINGFRVAPVNFSLTPGTYVVAGLRALNHDNPVARAPGVTTAPGITYISERELLTSNFEFPTGNFPDNEKGSFGPSFIVAGASTDPTITSIVNSASFQPTYAPGTFVSIFGTGLAGTTRPWSISDFAGGNRLPTSLDGVSVKVNGVSAYVEYVSSTQLNIVIPDFLNAVFAPGFQVTVSSAGKPDATAWINVQQAAPAIFTWTTGTADNAKYVVAQHGSDFTNVGKVGLFPQQAANFTTPARANEVIVLYGTGIGPTKALFSSGLIADKGYPLAADAKATLDGNPIEVQYCGLVAGLADIYQVNIKLPANVTPGDHQLVIGVNGVNSASGLITVQ